MALPSTSRWLPSSPPKRRRQSAPAAGVETGSRGLELLTAAKHTVPPRRAAHAYSVVQPAERRRRVPLAGRVWRAGARGSAECPKRPPSGPTPKQPTRRHSRRSGEPAPLLEGLCSTVSRCRQSRVAKSAEPPSGSIVDMSWDCGACRREAPFQACAVEVRVSSHRRAARQPASGQKGACGGARLATLGRRDTRPTSPEGRETTLRHHARANELESRPLGRPRHVPPHVDVATKVEAGRGSYAAASREASDGIVNAAALLARLPPQVRRLPREQWRSPPPLAPRQLPCCKEAGRFVRTAPACIVETQIVPRPGRELHRTTSETARTR